MLVVKLSKPSKKSHSVLPKACKTVNYKNVGRENDAFPGGF